MVKGWFLPPSLSRVWFPPKRFPGSRRPFSVELPFIAATISGRNWAGRFSNRRQKEKVISVKRKYSIWMRSRAGADPPAPRGSSKVCEHFYTYLKRRLICEVPSNVGTQSNKILSLSAGRNISVWAIFFFFF